MICDPCKKGTHEQCPSRVAQDPSKPSMALSPECERIQLSGLCSCQHRVPDFQAMIEKSNAQLRAAGFSPPILEKG